MVLFWVVATVSVIGAFGVVTLRQPVHAALSLVGTLLTVAVAYVALQAHFLAAIQVIVYAGAIMVLFLFVIMLLAVQGEASSPTLGWMQPVAWSVAGAVALAIVVSLLAGGRATPTAAEVLAVTGGGNAERIADVLFGPFLLAFHLVGVLLLTGIVAAIGLVQRTAEEAGELHREDVPPLDPAVVAAASPLGGVAASSGRGGAA
jgi:NADH-quinone oxidoreductase subunit J